MIPIGASQFLRFLNTVDHDNLNGATRLLQLQPKILDCCEQRWGRIRRDNRPIHRRPGSRRSRRH